MVDGLGIYPQEHLFVSTIKVKGINKEASQLDVDTPEKSWGRQIEYYWGMSHTAVMYVSFIH
jgi:hypothetical protein